jgi:uncharacterized protein (TIGR03437 family)
MSRVSHTVILGLLFGLVVQAQRPVINPQGVVNGASFAGADQPGWAVAPGSIASLFGRDLAPVARQADALPLPRSLEGTSVTVLGVPAPLFYVSPTQINFQVPRNLPAASGPGVPIVVTTAAGASDPVLIPVKSSAVGIFTQGWRGCGQGAVQNIAADGSRTLNTPANGASPGSFATLYGTGMGMVYSPPPDGHPAPRDPLAIMISSPFPRLGLEGFAKFAQQRTYGGLAPDLVGVWQLDFQIPEDAPEGCAVPLTVFDTPSMSQPVMISIRRGGGQCQDAPLASFASLSWRKTVTTGPDPSALSTQETFTATFASGPENQVAPLPPVPEGRCPCACGDGIIPPGPRCSGMAPKTLDAGTLRLESFAGAAIAVHPALSSGEVIYAATLPAGSIRSGTVRVTGGGGPSVGPFETAVSIRPPIEITTPLPPGLAIPVGRPFRLTWSNGTADALVRMRIVAPYSYGEPSIDCTAPASDGEMTLGLIDSAYPRLPIGPSANAYIIVTVSPRAAQVQGFSAPGLTRGGTHEWSYEYRFYGLRIGSP